MNTSGMISVCLLISLLLAVQCAETDNRIMIVPPSAINIILSQYEQILVLFTTDEGSDKTRQAI